MIVNYLAIAITNKTILNIYNTLSRKKPQFNVKYYEITYNAWTEPVMDKPLFLFKKSNNEMGKVLIINHNNFEAIITLDYFSIVTIVNNNIKITTRRNNLALEHAIPITIVRLEIKIEDSRVFKLEYPFFFRKFYYVLLPTVVIPTLFNIIFS